MANAPALLECSGLRKNYGAVVAVDGVSFSIAPGESYGLLGPNGAGKTTTISMVVGLFDPDAGEVVVQGVPMGRDPTRAKVQIGYVPQDIALYPDLTARENLVFFGRLYGLGGDELGGRVEETLGLVGLVDRGDDRVDTYSGGMKRRLNIAAGMLHRPSLLVLDEPTVGVDPQSRNSILEAIEQLGRAGMAVLYTTHYMEEAERLCDRVGIIDEGRIVAEGTRRELVAMVGERDRVRIDASGDTVKLARTLRKVTGVDEVTEREGGVDVTGVEARRLLPALLEAAQKSRAQVGSVEVLEPDLESVFLHLTGKALRD